MRYVVTIIIINIIVVTLSIDNGRIVGAVRDKLGGLLLSVSVRARASDRATRGTVWLRRRTATR